MVRTAVHFVDVSIPGLSASDLAARAADAVQSGVQSFAGGLAAARREHDLRRGLRGLDTNQLRDLGLDRRAC
ncbi:MAG: hypothetical protein R3316_00170 [Rhodovibrionaceae bacterium]|nr:hypothetical protein [Rhodovibrionaceae bacterium]